MNEPRNWEAWVYVAIIVVLAMTVAYGEHRERQMDCPVCPGVEIQR